MTKSSLKNFFRPATLKVLWPHSGAKLEYINFYNKSFLITGSLDTKRVG